MNEPAPMNFNDLDVTSMYTSHSKGELAEKLRDDMTVKSCDVHLRKVAERRKAFIRTAYHPETDGKRTVLPYSAYAWHVQEALLRKCLERGLKLSWNDSVRFTDMLIDATLIEDYPSEDGRAVRLDRRARLRLRANVKRVVEYITQCKEFK